MVTSFRLAPMSPVILILTLVLLLLPIPFFVAAFTHHRLFVLPALVLLFIDAWTYLWFRPTVFIVGPTDIEVIWPPAPQTNPPRHHHARPPPRPPGPPPRNRPRHARGRRRPLGRLRLVVDHPRGLIRMYVSRIDNFIWIDRGHEQSWLITPEQPDVFVHALSGSHS
jgi:hypothetical protein